MSDETKGPRWITAAEAISDIHPITLNPGDVLAKDNNGNELIEFGEDGRSSDYVPKTDDLTGYWSVRNNDSTPSGEADVIVVHEDGLIELTALDGFSDSAAGKGLQITTGFGFDDGDDTPSDGGNVQIDLGEGINGGVNGFLDVRGPISLRSFLKLQLSTDPPSPAVEGMVYADTDHHLYYYNGSDWLQLDNAP